MRWTAARMRTMIDGAKTAAAENRVELQVSVLQLGLHLSLHVGDGVGDRGLYGPHPP